jgi:hypothetical protein
MKLNIGRVKIPLVSCKKVCFIDKTSINCYVSKFSLSVPLVMQSSDTISSPYDDVNKFFVLEPSARIFGSRSSGLRLVIRLMNDEQMFVDFGVIIGTRITVNSDCFFSFVIAHGT